MLCPQRTDDHAVAASRPPRHSSKISNGGCRTRWMGSSPQHAVARCEAASFGGETCSGRRGHRSAAGHQHHGAQSQPPTFVDAMVNTGNLEGSSVFHTGRCCRKTGVPGVGNHRTVFISELDDVNVTPVSSRRGGRQTAVGDDHLDPLACSVGDIRPRLHAWITIRDQVSAGQAFHRWLRRRGVVPAAGPRWAVQRDWRQRSWPVARGGVAPARRGRATRRGT